MSRLVLFVCTGNVCRSPMAAALFNALARRAGEDDTFVAQSAGTWALENDTASAHAITVMAERGIDISNHRGRTITRELMADAAVVITMERSHLEALAAEFPVYRKKIHLMSELNERTFDITDPYGGTLPEYQYCAQELENLIVSGYEKIKLWITENEQSNLS
jgi:protein-tyrosine-phosphatase